MASKKTTLAPKGPSIVGRFVDLLRGPGIVWLALACVVVVFIGGAAVLWKKYRSKITADPAYQLSAENINVTPQPPWIHADVKAEVLQNVGLKSVSVLEPDIAVRIGKAFSTHSWVAKVRRVSKHHPAGLEVDVLYRRPVAMVEVQGSDDRPGLMPVDAEGVVLPPEDFTKNEARQFPRVAAGGTMPLGPKGTPWGDPKVLGGARIAAVVIDAWKPLDLMRIVVVEAQTAAERVQGPTYEIHTLKGSRIRWGRSPSAEEPSIEEARKKLAWLQAYMEKNRGLVQEGRAVEIDLRDMAHPVVSAQTAGLSVPGMK